MPGYQYKAVDQQGQPARGRLDAGNEVDLELRLKRMGLDLITFRPVSDRTAALYKSRISRRDLIAFCFDMEQISRSGIPLRDGLRDLRDSIDNPRFREILAAVLEDLEAGKMFSACLAAHPAVFDLVFVSLIKAGEQAGLLTEIFENLGAMLKWQDELVAQTKRLMVYPIMVLLVMVGVVTFLLLYLVPQVVGLLKNMGMALPLQTRLLIGASEVLSRFWPVALGLPVALAVGGVVAVRRNPRMQYLWDHLKLRLPLTGVILQKIILARFANLFALMYRSGITILDALRTSEEIVANRVIADSLQRAGQQVAAGASLSETFRNLGIFPPLVIRMLRVGENTGALDAALLNISYFYSRDVSESVDRALKMLEPAMTVGLGLILALIMFSVMSPIYDMLGKLKF